MQLRGVFDAGFDLVRAAKGAAVEAHSNLNLLDLASQTGLDFVRNSKSAGGFSAETMLVGRLGREATFLQGENEIIQHVPGHSTSFYAPGTLKILSADGARFNIERRGSTNDFTMSIDLRNKTKINIAENMTTVRLPNRSIITQDQITRRLGLDGEAFVPKGIERVAPNITASAEKYSSSIHLGDGTRIDAFLKPGGTPEFSLVRGSTGGTRVNPGDGGIQINRKYSDVPIVSFRDPRADNPFDASMATGSLKFGMSFFSPKITGW